MALGQASHLNLESLGTVAIQGSRDLDPAHRLTPILLHPTAFLAKKPIARARNYVCLGGFLLTTTNSALATLAPYLSATF